MGKGALLALLGVAFVVIGWLGELTGAAIVGAVALGCGVGSVLYQRSRG